MNGFGMTGALSLAIALKSNTSLLELDISNNRIPMEGAAQFGKIFSSNDTLQILRVGSSTGLIFQRPSNQMFGQISNLLKTLPVRREGLYK